MRDSILYFGCNPRRCLEVISFADLKHLTDDFESSIYDVATKRSDEIIRLLRDTRTGASDISHTVFQVFPSNTDPNRLYSNCQIETVSPWALDRILHYHAAHRADLMANFYYQVSSVPAAGSLRGHLFERQILNHLSGIDSEKPFSIRALTNSKKKTWTYRGPIRRTDFQKLKVVPEITRAVRDQESLHLVPAARNFPAADSILYDPEDSDAALTCIQVTSKENHPISVKGLRDIQNWLQGRTLEHIRPTKRRPWRFLFVVPSYVESNFKMQQLDGDTDRGEWAGKVHQYVLGLEEETIFGPGSNSSANTSQQGEQQVWC